MGNNDCPKILRYLGIGLETDFGTPVDAEVHMDITNGNLDSPSEPEMTYDGGLSRGIRVHKPGAYISEGTVGYAMDINSIFWLLYLVFGNLTIDEEGEGPVLYDYNFVPKRHDLCLPSATFRLGKDHYEHVFPGCVVSQIEISVDDEFAQVTATVVGGKDIKADVIIDLSTLELPDQYPLAFHELNISLGGGDRSADINSITLTINNNANGDEGVKMGSRYPQKIYAGDIDVSASVDVDFVNMDEKEAFWGAAGGVSDDGSTTSDITLTFGTENDGDLIFTIPKLLLTEVPHQPSGRDTLVQSISGTAIFDDDSDTEIAAKIEGTEIDYDTLAALPA